MKELVKQYLDRGITRRKLMSGLTAVGMTGVAAQSLAPAVAGATDAEPGQIKDALARAKRATVEGRPYLLDVLTQRDGIGAASTWHPPYSLAEARTRKV